MSGLEKLLFCFLNAWLQEHFHVINAEHADQSGRSDLPAVKQFELLGALIEVVAQGNAVLPFLNFPAFRPKLQVNGIASLEHLS